MKTIALQSVRHSPRWLVLVGCLVLATLAHAFTPSTKPPAAGVMPGNLLLALSVEVPTGLQESYSEAYSIITKYDGYFDNRKCYAYSTTNEVFTPVSRLDVTNGTCPVSTQWSGNLLNWLTMTNIDQFRYVLTGGTRDNFSSMSTAHPGDTTGRTVLIRSSSDRNEYSSEKVLTALPGMPLGAGTKIARAGGFGSKFIVNASRPGGNVGINRANIDSTCANLSLGSGDVCFNVRVEVCISVPVGQAVPDVALEANCKSGYSGVPKPEGLVQEYADTLRYGAFSYLNDSVQTRNGGVLRSAMKSVGPSAATASGVIANTAKEWNETTGILIANPDAADAAAISVSNSGFINYVNRFGYATGYKSYDPVSELYYAAQLYLRGRAPPSDYSSNLNAANKDNFPVITGSNLLAGGARDPIIGSCQKNFILGIGDMATHCDGNLPGSTKNNSQTCGSTMPTDPDGLDVQALWNATRALEGLADNGWVGGSVAGTPYMVGLAHWGHTNDIRPDLSGKQTISTYWVDVIQANVVNIARARLNKTQFWLSAKYGGFDTSLVPGTDPNVNRASWDADGDGVPDNWFAGNTPGPLRAGLAAAFADIAVRSGANSASSAATTSNRQTASSQVLYAGYNPKGWVGSVRACPPAQTAAQCEASPTWEASNWFKTTAPTAVASPLTPATRKIFTSYGGGLSLTSMRLNYENLNSAQKAVLDASDGNGSARVAYLRGDRTYEVSVFRKRDDKLLGDIVNSGVSYLSGAGPQYPGVSDAAYQAFRACNKSGCAARPNPRRPVIYVGANDGMLHAFSGVNGKELFAYVPGAVFGNLNALTTPGYAHKFYVDSTPMIGDVPQNATTWRTLLVGGLGAGGKGYYALNITDANAFSTAWSDDTINALPANETSAQAAAKETALSSLPLWEFTSGQDSDLGYTFNEPSSSSIDGRHLQIARVADGSVNGGIWRVIVGNGYGSASGKAALFMLDANTGVNSAGGAPVKLVADPGPGTDNGLSTPTPVDTDKDGLIDTVYAGDLLGNLHKFQFSKLDAGGVNYVLAPAGTSGGGAWRYIGKVIATGQPITTAPSVAQACGGRDWYVGFGTGKFNENGDYGDSSSRGFYALKDVNPSSALTVTATDVVDIPYTAATASRYSVRNWTAPNLANKKGWKMAFTGGERVLSNSTLPPDTGAILFATTKPTGDVCQPGNSGFIMAVNFCSGKSGELSVDNTLFGGFAVDSAGVVKVSNTYTDSGNNQAVVCNQDGCKPPPCTGAGCTPSSPPSLIVKVAPKGRYSWRELLTK